MLLSYFKRFDLLHVGLGFLFLTASTSAQVLTATVQQPTKLDTTKRVEARVVITQAELDKKLKTAKTFEEQMKDISQPLQGPAPSLQHTLYTTSIILFDGSSHTVIPLGAILHLPPQYQNRVIGSPVGGLILWPDFLTKNAGWLSGYEVPLAMAKGDTKEAGKIYKKIEKETEHESKLLVATYKTYPISIMEPVSTEKPTSPAKTSSTNSISKSKTPGNATSSR